MGQGTVFTVGHGARSLDELVAVLQAGGARLLVDVRRFPASRRHPHFARAPLQVALPGAGIAYSFRGDELGGRRTASKTSRHMAWREPGFRGYADWMESDTFRAALGRLELDARTSRAPCVMCAETLWWRCHRRLIADALVVDGYDVVHLVSPTSRQPHKPADIMRVDARGLLVYDVGCLPL